jgi:hypothetical protein
MQTSRHLNIAAGAAGAADTSGAYVFRVVAMMTTG